MDLNLKGKVFVVTGGASGIGRAISETLSGEGATPFIVDRNTEHMLNLSVLLKEKGQSIDWAEAELTVPEQCKAVIDKAVSRWGKIDGIVNNAGVNDTVGLELGNCENFMGSLKKNLLHYYAITHYALPELKKTKGSIINIGSKVSETGQGGTSGYAAANGGRNALTREWAVELLPFSIRVNSVIVAECLTPLYEKWINSFSHPKAELQRISQNIPLEKRMTKANEIANTVAFLLSERSSHTTGQLLYVDGGYTHLDRSLN